MKKKNSNNGKTATNKNRGKNRADLSRRKSYGINRNNKPQKNLSHRRELPGKLPEMRGLSFKSARQSKAKNTAPESGNRENYKKGVFKTTADTSENQAAGQPLSGLKRWHNNPRITGAVAAVLLFATLAIAIIPTSLNVRAEEQAETAALDPTMQLAKEYIYAGSRMLAIEDYGLSAGTPAPSPAPTVTPTPVPQD